MSVMCGHWPVRRQTHGYLLSCKASLLLAGTKLYCSVTEAHVCYQLAQGCTLQRGSWDLKAQPIDRMSDSLQQATHCRDGPREMPHQHCLS